MSKVLLRCPNCGTTRSSPGECDACHEAQVRFYCTNHNPGLWLEGRTCTACGATFGVAERVAPTVAPKVARPARERFRTTGSTPPRPRPMPRPPMTSPPDREPEPRSEERWVEPGVDVSGPRRMPTLRDILLATAQARARSREAAAAGDGRAPGRGPAGCLARAVLILVFLIFGLVSALTLLGGSLFRMF